MRFVFIGLKTIKDKCSALALVRFYQKKEVYRDVIAIKSQVHNNCKAGETFR